MFGPHSQFVSSSLHTDHPKAAPASTAEVKAEDAVPAEKPSQSHETAQVDPHAKGKSCSHGEAHHSASAAEQPGFGWTKKSKRCH